MVARALSLLGQGKYNGLLRNCEHFARFCKTGEGGSAQITSPIASVESALKRSSERLAQIETRPMLFVGQEAPSGSAAALFPPPHAPPLPQWVAASAAAGSAKVAGVALKLVKRGAQGSDDQWKQAMRKQRVTAADHAAPAGSHAVAESRPVLRASSAAGAPVLPWCFAEGGES